MDYLAKLLATEIPKLSVDQWMALALLLWFPFMGGWAIGETKGWQKGVDWARSMRPYSGETSE